MSTNPKQLEIRLKRVQPMPHEESIFDHYDPYLVKLDVTYCCPAMEQHFELFDIDERRGTFGIKDNPDYTSPWAISYCPFCGAPITTKVVKAVKHYSEKVTVSETRWRDREEDDPEAKL